MTGDPILTLALCRDKEAEATIRAGPADYNTARFRPGDLAILDVLVRIPCPPDGATRIFLSKALG